MPDEASPLQESSMTGAGPPPGQKDAPLQLLQRVIVVGRDVRKVEETILLPPASADPSPTPPPVPSKPQPPPWPWGIQCQGPRHNELGEKGRGFWWTPPMTPLCTKCFTSPPSAPVDSPPLGPWQIHCQGPPDCVNVFWWTPPMEPVCKRCRDLFSYYVY